MFLSSRKNNTYTFLNYPTHSKGDQATVSYTYLPTSSTATSQLKASQAVPQNEENGWSIVTLRNLILIQIPSHLASPLETLLYYKFWYQYAKISSVDPYEVQGRPMGSYYTLRMILGNLIRSHGFKYHVFQDNTQLKKIPLG